MPDGYTFDLLKDELSSRIKAMPIFREKLADSPFNLDHPVWVEDDDFDVDRHVHRIGLPAPGVFGIAMRVYSSSRLTESRPVHNLVISNVPGPQLPLYFLGAEIKAMYPLGPIFHGSGLNITVMSLWDLADDFSICLDELLAASWQHVEP